MRIGILGGSFDPVHNGHIDMAEYCLNFCGLDKVMFLPLGDPPHKENITCKEHRIEMLKTAIEYYDKFFIDLSEVERSGKTYTYDTISRFLRDYDDEFYYIIGGDTIKTLHKWYRADELFKIIKFIVVSRPGYEFGEEKKSLILRGAQLIFTEYTGLDISSTDIKKKIQNGEDISNLVPKGVCDLIVKNGLYKNC